MFQTARKLLAMLDRNEKRNLLIVILLALVSAVSEMISVASILPFLAIVANPETAMDNAIVARMVDLFGLDSGQEALSYMAGLVILLIATSLCFRVVTIYANARFSNMRAYSLASRLVAEYLRQPYEWFITKNTGELGKKILIETQRVVGQAIMPIMSIISQAAVVVLLFLLLLTIDPATAIAAAAVFSVSYVLVFVLARRALDRIGREILDANGRRFRVIQEGMACVKELKVLGVERTFLNRFREPTLQLSTAQAKGAVINETPRFVLQAIAFITMLVFVMFLLNRNEGGLAGALPVLGVFAFAALRLFPALQQIYRDFGMLKISKPAVDEIYHDLMVARSRTTANWATAKDAQPLPLTDHLDLDRVSYTYPESSRPALHDLSLRIGARSTVGVVGGTGAGKSTLIDLMLGLFTPTQGQILVDGTALTQDNIRNWQKNIGYVPQQISLLDDSVTANIAFGIVPEEVDMTAVERAARMAELDAFVRRDLPEGYATRVGDRGVRLSGGQRQRIGIARALYRDPEVLIFDEATSALDNLTERAVMEAVGNLGGAKTIVMIAHRLSTVRNCDNIVFLENGRIADQGTYEDLLGKSVGFRQMANA